MAVVPARAVDAAREEAPEERQVTALPEAVAGADAEAPGERALARQAAGTSWRRGPRCRSCTRPATVLPLARAVRFSTLPSRGSSRSTVVLRSSTAVRLETRPRSRRTRRARPRSGRSSSSETSLRSSYSMLYPSASRSCGESLRSTCGAKRICVRARSPARRHGVCVSGAMKVCCGWRKYGWRNSPSTACSIADPFKRNPS